MHATDPDHQPPAATADHRHAIHGLAQWHHTLLAMLAHAEETACPRIVLCSPQFIHWPLSDTQVMAAMQTWLRPQRRLVLVANTFDPLLRTQPRFVAWRNQWDSIVLGRVVIRQFRSETPSFALAGSQAAWLANPDLFAGSHGSDPALVQQVAEQADEWIDNRSVNGFAARTLGL